MSHAQKRLAQMFHAHAAAAQKALRRAGLDAVASDDALQQVFVVAARRLSDIAPACERAFLVRVALRVAARTRARRAREQPMETVSELESAGPRAEEVYEAKVLKTQIARLLAQLERPLRDVVVLSDLEGLSKREVSALLKIPQGTAASRLRRARGALGALLQRPS